MYKFVAVLAVTAAAFAGPRSADAQDSMLGSCKSTIRPQGQTPEPITDRPAPADALRFTFVGTPVVITCDDMVLQARTIIYETDTQDIRASGDVLLQQRDLRVFAERAEMNSRTKLGVFYQANGIARIGEAPEEKSQFGTQESDVSFTGERIEKSGPKTYKIHHGSFTTCAQPVPRWEMTMGDATITMDEHALMRNVILRVKDVPVFYLPAFYYPMEKDDRSSGFLLPTYGASNLRGTTLSNAFFWAISRSQDATFFHDWTSKFGQGFGSEYRYVKSAGSRGNVKFFGTNTPGTADEQGNAAPASRSYDVSGDVNQALPRNFRLIGRVNYFTDIATQQLYQDVYQSDQRQRRDITANVSGTVARMRITAGGELHEYFYDKSDPVSGVVSASRQRNGRMPIVNVSMPDRAIGSSKIYVGGAGTGRVPARSTESRRSAHQAESLSIRRGPHAAGAVEHIVIPVRDGGCLVAYHPLEQVLRDHESRGPDGGPLAGAHRIDASALRSRGQHDRARAGAHLSGARPQTRDRTAIFHRPDLLIRRSDPGRRDR